jgi:2-amino-4-hydroxy-6-hydroxymethyldihydropteridine diphosphokinase
MRPRAERQAIIQPDGLAFIALGSNLGNARENVSRAMDRLEVLSQARLLRSSLWRTSPVDCPPGSQVFVNAAVGLAPFPGETPASLLSKLKGIEMEFGRTPKKVLNEPRPLDLDLVAFGTVSLSTPTLALPHPRAAHRRFVLQPLSEIAPEFRLPGQEMTVEELLETCPPDANLCILGEK